MNATQRIASTIRRANRRRLFGRFVKAALCAVLATTVATSTLASADPQNPLNEPDDDPITGMSPGWSPSPLGFTYKKASRVKGWQFNWNPGGQTGWYNDSYLNPTSFTANFDGCRTETDGVNSINGTPTLNTYQWSYNGKTLTTDDCSGVELFFPAEGEFPVTLKVIKPGGAVLGTWNRDVVVKDLIIVIIGDSMSSGEGSPNLGQPAWIDNRCHRSANSGGVKAAERVEASGLASVTLLNFACSGARINTDWRSYWGILDPYELTNPSSGSGIVGGYVGMDEDATIKQKSQLQQIKDAVGNKEIDAIIMSAGLNDAGFAKMMQVCVLFINCFDESVGYSANEKPLKTQFKSDVDKLPAHFTALKAEIDRLGIKVKRKLLMEYPNPLTGNNGNLCSAILEDAVANGLFGGFFSVLDIIPFKGWASNEVKWASDGPFNWLSAGLRKGALIGDWEMVEGVSAAFQGHGYCASDGKRFINTSGDAHKIHGGKIMTSTMHPTIAGYTAMADRIMVNLRPNVPPILWADSYTTKVNTPLTVAAPAGVLANDTDEDVNDVLRAKLSMAPTKGILALREGGGFSYLAKPGFVGTDSFWYVVKNGTFDRVQRATIVVKPGASNVVAPLPPAVLEELGELFPSADDAAATPRPMASENGPVSEYFSDTFGDPLDYANTEDVALVTEGPIQGVASKPTLSDGQLRLEFNKAGYFSPAWSGYDAGGDDRGSSATAHDREIANHPIDPALYSKVRVRMNVSAAVGAGVQFYTCAKGVNSTCETTNPFVTTVGWRTYEFDLPKGAPVTGIRVAITPDENNPSVRADVDWVQVVGPHQGNAVGDGSAAGPVPEILNPDIAGAVPYLFPRGGDPVPYRGRTCANNDWATQVIGDPWDFNTRSDIVLAEQYKSGWTANGRFSGQWDRATFGPKSSPGDPNLRLNMGKNVIDTKTFHRVTALLGKYDGNYSQQFIPDSDSGWVFRVMSKAKLADQVFQQFNPVTEYPNDTTLSIDLKDPTPYDGVVAKPTESTEKIAGQTGWVGTQALFRVDLFEPYNERFSYADEVLLATDDCGLRDFDIEFAENNNSGGSAELMYAASPQGPWKKIANVRAQPGRNTYKWTAPAGSWWIKVGITGTNGSYGENVSTGPVAIGTEFAKQITANRKLKGN